MDSRVNLEHKVLLLLEVCDGVENIAHGQDGAAVGPPVLHVRRAFLRVVEQHAAWKQSQDQSDPRRHHPEVLLPSARFSYQFLRRARQCKGLSLSLCCSGPKEETGNGSDRVLVTIADLELGYREERAQTVGLLWVLRAAVFVQPHHELLAAKQEHQRFQVPREATVGSSRGRHAAYLICLASRVSYRKKKTSASSLMLL